jgi:hypothetical protein
VTRGLTERGFREASHAYESAEPREATTERLCGECRGARCVESAPGDYCECTTCLGSGVVEVAS